MTTVPTFVQGQELSATELNAAFAAVAYDVQQDTAAAAASAAAAAASAATAKGVISLTSVGGTSTAFTAVGQGAPTVGVIYSIVLNANSGAAPVTLSIDGTTARQLRQSSGAQPVEGQFPADVELFFKYQSNTTFRQVSDLLDEELFIRPTVMRLGVRDPAATGKRAGIDMLNDGRIGFRTGGDGVTDAAIKTVVNADGSIRMTTGRFLTGNSTPVFSEPNPPPPTNTARQLLRQMTGPWWELATDATVATGARPYCVSGYDVARGTLRLPSGLDALFEQMPETSSLTIFVQASCVFHSGWTGFTWNGAGGATKLAVTAGVWRVHKTFTDLVCEAVTPFTTTSGAAFPTFSAYWAGLGQSWPNRGIRHWIYGIQKRRQALSLNRDVFIYQGTAFGASDLLSGTTSDPNNYYWDQNTDSPGPNYTAMMAAIAASPDAGANLTDVIVQYGLNGMTTFAATGDNTPAIRIAMQLSMQAQMRADLVLPNLRFWIVPLTSQQLGTFDEEKWYEMRKSQLDTVDQDPDGLTFRAPDCYDLPRPFGDDNFAGTDDRHYSFYFQALHGARLAAAIANEVDAQTNYTGPRITAVARTAANTYTVTVDRGVGLDLNRPPAPVGFGVCNGDFATTLEIIDYSWSGDVLTLTTATDDAGALPVYPYGSAWEMEAQDRIVGALDPVSGEFWPLQTYHDTV